MERRPKEALSLGGRDFSLDVNAATRRASAPEASVPKGPSELNLCRAEARPPGMPHNKLLSGNLLELHANQEPLAARAAC